MILITLNLQHSEISSGGEFQSTRMCPPMTSFHIDGE